eukprot:3777519-Rhodomonas_salina.2
MASCRGSCRMWCKTSTATTKPTRTQTSLRTLRRAPAKHTVQTSADPNRNELSRTVGKKAPRVRVQVGRRISAVTALLLNRRPRSGTACGVKSLDRDSFVTWLCDSVDVVSERRGSVQVLPARGRGSLSHTRAELRV